MTHIWSLNSWNVRADRDLNAYLMGMQCGFTIIASSDGLVLPAWKSVRESGKHLQGNPARVDDQETGTEQPTSLKSVLLILTQPLSTLKIIKPKLSLCPLVKRNDKDPCLRHSVTDESTPVKYGSKFGLKQQFGPTLAIGGYPYGSTYLKLSNTPAKGPLTSLQSPSSTMTHPINFKFLFLETLFELKCSYPWKTQQEMI